MPEATASFEFLSVIKVPLPLARQWEHLGKIAEQDGNVHLASINKKKRQLELSEATNDEGKLAKRYDINSIAIDPVPTMLFKRLKEGAFELEGCGELLAATPIVDADYAKAIAAASAEANAEKYFTKADTSVILHRQGALHSKEQITRVKKQRKVDKQEFEGRKQELEGQLFERFQDVGHWQLKDLARALQLSNAQTSQLLAPIAMHAKSGPYRGQWVLKPEYRQNDESAVPE